MYIWAKDLALFGPNRLARNMTIRALVSNELFDAGGNRKYLSASERDAFMLAAGRAPRDVRTFCALLHYSGCRLTEALELTYDRIDLSEGTVVFETLKKRRKGVYCSVPVPASLIESLDLCFDVREKQRSRGGGKGERLWDWSRATVWRRVKDVMVAAKIGDGPQASPKGLRHGFGVNAVSRGIPLNMVMKWMTSGWGTRSYRPRPSMPMPWGRKKKASPSRCGR